jgi:hypothetical protein
MTIEQHPLVLLGQREPAISAARAVSSETAAALGKLIKLGDLGRSGHFDLDVEGVTS